MEHLAKRGQRPVCPPAGVIDLHCDTLTRDQWEEDSGGDTLDNPGYHLSLGGLPAGRFWVQCFAIFVPDQLRGREAIGFFDRYHASFCRQMEANRDRILPCRSFLDLERARAQAAEFGHSPEREVCYLAVHSVLHLLGYDHLDEGPMKARMRACEEAILGKLGITREGAE